MTKPRVSKSDSDFSLRSILARLNSMARPEVVEYNARVGLGEAKSLGIPTPELKKLAAEIKKASVDRHTLADELWSSGGYDARAIAFMIDDPRSVTTEQMESWVKDFDNWATVDGACGYLFCRTPYAYQKAFEWSEREPEFEKRAGFSMMAYLAVHDKKADDETLAEFFPVMERHAYDERNFVKKAVNWALRQIGKRNVELNQLAIESARRIQQQNSSSARWIAADALRELQDPVVKTRLATKEERKRG
jgi:3-methyladenine DNA glycosylase AlkD